MGHFDHTDFTTNFDPPDELSTLHQWVLWRSEDRDGKPTKCPYQARARLYRARSDDPRTWASFDTAIEMHRHHAGHIDGIGFVFAADDPFCGIDVDNCFPSDAAECAPWAEGILERFSDTYSEESPSGKGVKIWVRAKGPRCGRWPIAAGAIEIYDHARFFTVTGRSAGLTAIVDHQDDIDALVANLDGDRVRAAAPSPSTIAGGTIPQGQRHPTLVSLAGTMFRRGMTFEAIEAALLVTDAQQCNPPHGPEHVRKIVASMQRWVR